MSRERESTSRARGPRGPRPPSPAAAPMPTPVIRPLLLALGFALLAPLLRPLHADDLFLRLATYFVTPGPQRVRIPVLNGSFARSEHAVARSRVRDLTVVSAEGTSHPPTSAWSDDGNTSHLTVPVRRPGTYVVGASTRPRTLRLDGAAFDEYLREDGIDAVLADRTERALLGTPARERYAKHAKAVFQAGGHFTPTHAAVLGYPAEIVPLANPYELSPGDTLPVRCLVDGRPVVHQSVVAGGELRGEPFEPRRARTDSAGVVRVPLRQAGQWYVKFVHMAPVADDPELDYESKWATLTFEVR